MISMKVRPGFDFATQKVEGKVLADKQSFYTTCLVLTCARVVQSQQWVVTRLWRVPKVLRSWMGIVVREIYARTQVEGVKMIEQDWREWFLSQPLFADGIALVAE